MNRGFLQGFRVRLIAGAAIWISAGIGFSYAALVSLLRDHVESEFVEELDHHGTELSGLLRLDAAGRLGISQPLSDHRFFELNSGYYWQVQRGEEVVASPSLGKARLPAALAVDGKVRQQDSTIASPTGQAMMLQRILEPNPALGKLRLSIATDRRLIDDVIAGLRHTLGLSLASIALGLIAAAVIQVSYGLKPLGRIRLAVAAVRRGEAKRLPDTLPSEVAPLAASVNALLATNEEIVRRARTQAGNLAHALKTPLAVLMDEASRIEAAGGDGRVIHEQCERMRRQIDYQMAKARAAASRSGVGAASAFDPALTGIVSALERLYRDRGLVFEVQNSEPEVIVACEREDLDEMIGNLLDNASKWARSRVRITVLQTYPGRLSVSIEDDGPGMPEEARERVFNAGERLDEMVPGTGLGLAIVRDVAELYGGTVWIDTSTLGGAAVHLELPVVTGA